jgi:hypothetical protein
MVSGDVHGAYGHPHVQRFGAQYPQQYNLKSLRYSPVLRTAEFRSLALGP